MRVISIEINTGDIGSTKLHAIRVKNVFTCQRALRAYVLMYQRAFRAYVLTCQRSCRGYVPTCSAANVPSVKQIYKREIFSVN